MSDTTVAAPAAEASPAAPPIPQAPIPPPVVQPPKADSEAEVRLTSAQLKARLDEERAKGERRAAEQFSQSLGVDPETAKRLIAEYNAKEDASKSEVRRLTEQLAAERAKLSQFEAYRTTVQERSALEYESLSETQRAAVDKIAGTDPAARLRTIDALRPTWTAATQAAQAEASAAAQQAAQEAATKAAEEAKRKPLPPPAATSPATPAPVPAAPGQPTNHLAVYESLVISNPAMAAKYRAQHALAISAAKRQTSG